MLVFSPSSEFFNSSLLPLTLIFIFSGKELPYENTWNGFSTPQPNRQPLATATLQKSPLTKLINLNISFI
jgi:hypothetical protein